MRRCHDGLGVKEGWDRQAAFRYPALISDGLDDGYGILKLGLGKHGLWDADEKGAFNFELQHVGIKAVLMMADYEWAWFP